MTPASQSLFSLTLSLTVLGFAVFICADSYATPTLTFIFARSVYLWPSDVYSLIPFLLPFLTVMLRPCKCSSVCLFPLFFLAVRL